MGRLFYFVRLYAFRAEIDLQIVMNTIAEQYLGCAELDSNRGKIVDPDGNDILVTASHLALRLHYLDHRMETLSRLRSLACTLRAAKSAAPVDSTPRA
jgi:hypothetical protein